MAQAGLMRLRAWKLLRLLPHRSYVRALVRQRVAASVEHSAVPFAHDFRTVLDVGAHTGQFALFASRRFPRAHIYCVEPLPSALARLRKVTEGMQVSILPYAAAEHEQGDAILRVTRDTDSSSLLVAPGLAQVGEERISTRRLDSFDELSTMSLPALLKIDVQGYELEVLRGATRLLDHVDQMLIECSFRELYQAQPLADEVICHVRDRFLLDGVFGMTYDQGGNALQADLLFSRRR